MYNMACEMAKKISDKHWELLREFNINGKIKFISFMPSLKMGE
jgi:hypothetical protein